MTALARIDPGPSVARDGWMGGAVLELHLSQGVPFRVFTLDGPPRLVVDFREADWSGVTEADLLPDPGVFSALRFGRFQPGWSRLVADLSGPFLPDNIGMPVDPQSGKAVLTIGLDPVDPEAFAAASGVPETALWPERKAPQTPAPIQDGRLVVVIDPGHGGVDPGAERDGVAEKDLMLTFARLLRDALRRAGDAEVVLTREADEFISLESRVAVAHRSGADLFISLHADSLSQGGAQGAAIYTLSDEASDKATELLAARHNRADIIAGADLTGSDDQVAGVLLDLARQETEPRSAALARSFAVAMKEAGGPMNRHPLREAGFSVLKSADIPSVLIEIGFLSSDRDLGNLTDPDWQRRTATAMARAVLDWRDADAARRDLVRQ
ncbi:N-acetylmuramoyl-L-alanine amidase [Sulfitobacter sp. D35]|nr:N-acetylmuramoyl-L-alanine amidase [Sulfitobacter sp. D35]MDW4497667.1 N-acetylmuramoyl-L-alanine amidase [Sulfitobacter sp. D35]